MGEIILVNLLRQKGAFIFILTIIFLMPFLGSSSAEEEGPKVIDEKLQMELADHFFAEGDYYRAVTEYKRFLFFFPHSAQVEEVYMKMTKAYLQGQRWEDALAILDRWQSKFPQSSRQGEISLLKGLCHLGKKEFALARHFLAQAKRAAPGTGVEEEAYFFTARTYLEEEKWQEAAAELRKINKKSPLFARGDYLARGLDKINEVPQKSPALAGVLAALLPGAGHLYNERYRDAAMAFLLNAVFIWGMIEAFQHENYALGAILTFGELGWYSGNIYGAISSAHKYNRQKKKEYLENLEKGSPWSGGIFFHGQALLAGVRFAF